MIRRSNRPTRRAAALLIAATALACLTGCRETKKSDQTEVSVMTFEWGTGKDNYRTRQELINEQFDDIDVTIRYTAFGTYVPKLLASFAGNMAPDLLFSMTGRDRLFISKGVFRPLNEFIESADGLSLDDFNTTIIREQMTRDGQIYALPQTNNTLALYYNKDLFQREGIPFLSETEPITWDQFREIAVKLTKDLDGDGTPDQYGCVPGFDNVQPTYFFFVLNASFGGRAFSEDGKTAYLDSSETIAAVTWLHSLIHEYKCAPTPDFAQQMAGFFFPSNRLGLLVNGPWTGYELSQSAPDMEFGVAPLPYQPGHPRTNMVGGTAVGISSASKNPQEAWRVLKFLLSPTFQKLPIQGLPGRLSVMDDPQYEGLPYWQIFRAETAHATSDFFIERYDEITTIVRQYGERILTDAAARPRIPQMLGEMNAQINKLLAAP